MTTENFKYWPKSEKTWIILIALLSLLIRFFMINYSAFSVDESNFYNSVLPFWQHGELPSKGQVIVYTSTFIPGSLQPFLGGLALFLSHGMPWGIGVMIALLNFFAIVIIYKLYSELFPQFKRWQLALFIFFTPWSILNNNIWNPSFLPFFSAIFFWGIIRILKENKDLKGWSAIVFSIFSSFQFHLSFVLLIGILILLFVSRFVRSINWKGVMLGAIPTGIFLLPYLLESTSGSKTDFLEKNIVLNNHFLKNFSRIFIRNLSFITGESGHFYAGGGVRRMVNAISHLPYLYPTWFIGTVLSIVIILISIKFYFNLDRLKFWTKTQSALLEKLDFIIYVIPFMTWISFFFSIKSPSQHTFWIIFPFAFYPFLRVISTGHFIKHKAFSAILATYIISIMSYSIIAVVKNPKAAHLQKVMHLATQKMEGKQVQLDSMITGAVNSIIKVKAADK